MKKIPLTQGQVALVDDADFARFGHMKWTAQRGTQSGNFYAFRRGPLGRFIDKKIAAAAYARANHQHFGEFGGKITGTRNAN